VRGVGGAVGAVMIVGAKGGEGGALLLVHGEVGGRLCWWWGVAQIGEWALEKELGAAPEGSLITGDIKSWEGNAYEGSQEGIGKEGTGEGVFWRPQLKGKGVTFGGLSGDTNKETWQ